MIREVLIDPGRNRLLMACICLLLFAVLPGKAEDAQAGITVRLNAKTPLRLQLSVRSFAKVQTTIYRSDLPWGIRDSIVLIAVRPNGEYLEQNPIADDPSPEKVSLGPNESITGEIDLSRVFKKIDTATMESDILLFWAYEAPKGLALPRWSGGWLLLPQQTK